MSAHGILLALCDGRQVTTTPEDIAAALSAQGDR